MNRVIATFMKEDTGADLIEYALLVGLISLGCYTALTSTTTSLTDFFGRVTTKLGQVLP
jgi:Flp pilus assembly pilin Flp